MSQFERVSRTKKCPVCDGTDWCLVAQDKTAAICPRVEKGSTKYIDGSGYLHVLVKGDRSKAYSSQAVQSYRSELPLHNTVIAEMMKTMLLKSSDKRMEDLVSNTELPGEVWLDLMTGHSRVRSAYAFPMFRKGHQLIGIRFRSPGGRKFSQKGSREGLFIPKSYDKDKRPVVVCEGPTDTAAALFFDFRTVGRPSCLGGQKLLVELLQNQHVCILADSDGPGQTGAQKLAQALDPVTKSVSIATPPAKDLREWKYQGCQRQDLLKLIRGAATSQVTT
tara:strand:- start:419 stop:1252 length:834 start_codon:yes stop_codon:yes gene_type:complete